MEMRERSERRRTSVRLASIASSGEAECMTFTLSPFLSVACCDRGAPYALLGRSMAQRACSKACVPDTPPAAAPTEQSRAGHIWQDQDVGC
eukprot:3067730-Rhodomonas_salina.5